MEGRDQELKDSKGFRRVFDRMRDIVSPTGLIPEYGDAYFMFQTFCPMDGIYLLEYAAKLYDDPSYLYAARKLYHHPDIALPDLGQWVRGLPLINMECSHAAPVAPTGPPSEATYRRNYNKTEDDIDKLILRIGWEPGSAMIMLDVYAHGSHAHSEKGPSVGYYEVGGVPLFHNLGRNGVRSSVAGNLLFSLPATEPFPGCFNKPHVWTTMSIPIDHLSEVPTNLSPAELDEFEKHQDNTQPKAHYLAGIFCLRDFPVLSRNCQYLYFDNLRLGGPGGELLVDGFEQATGPMFGWNLSS